MKHTFPNGLTLLVEEAHITPLAAVQIWVGFGSANEPEDLAGVAHVIEHMVFKASESRAAGDMARKVEAAGGHINAWTSFDETVFHLAVPTEKLALAVDLLADAVGRPAFLAEELGSELKVILEEVSQGEDEPSHLCIERLFEKAFKDHPYRRPIIGYRETVEALKGKDLKKIHKRHYSAGNLTVVVAGDVEADKVVKLVGKKMGAFPTRKKPPQELPKPSQKRLRLAVKKADVSEVHVALGFHIPGLTHDDSPDLDLLAIILGQGDSSRLQTKLRRDRQLVSQIYAYAFTPKDLGLLVVGATIPVDRFDEAIEEILAEVFRTCSEDVSTEELSKAMRILTAESVYQAETVQGLARKVGYYQTLAGDPDYEERYIAAARMATPTTLQKVAAKYLTPQGLTVSVVSPGKSRRAKGARGAKGKKGDPNEASISYPLDQPASKIGKHLREKIKKAHQTAQKRSALPSLKVGRAGVYKHELSSGARVLVLPDESVPLTAFRAVWLGGLRGEKPSSNGISNIMAGMFTRGTASMSGEECVKAMEAMGGAIAGVAGRNTLGLRAETLSGNWRAGMEIVADCLKSPALDEEELEKEKKNALDELKAQQDNLTIVVFRMFRKALFGSHPYGMPLLGDPKSLQSLTRRKLRAFHRKHCRPQDMVLSVVGDVDPARVVQAAERHFGKSFSTKPPSLKVNRPPSIDEPIIKVAHKERKQAHIVLGYQGLSATNPDRFASEILTAVLSGQGGRLFVELRDRMGLAYRVNATTVEGIDPGYLAVYIATTPENTDTAIRAIRHQLDRVRKRKVGKKELREVKNHLVGSHAISLQRRNSLASSLALNEIYGLRYDEHIQYKKNVMQVTAEEVRAIAEKYLDPSSEVLAVLTPEG